VPGVADLATQLLLIRRLARPISSLAMNTSNSSRASSVAVTSSQRTVASSVAILRRYGCRPSFGAFAAIPYRASSITRRVGTDAMSASRMPSPAISATRSSCSSADPLFNLDLGDTHVS